jgi:hypothetical protein
MLLSEAIREGAKKRPQNFEWYFSRVGSGVVTSCALGAAFESWYGEPNDGIAVSDILYREFPVLNSIIARCPTGTPGCKLYLCGIEVEVYATIGHLNDDHKWSREQIADYVATIEATNA